MSTYLFGAKTSKAIADQGVKIIIPKQFYSCDLPQFIEQFLAYLQTIDALNNKIVLFVDGVAKYFKDCLDKIEYAICAALLISHKLDVEVIDLSQIMSMPASEIHASELILKVLTEYIKSLDAVWIVVGSGSMTDLVKHAVFLNQKKQALIVIPTALTVTAYTSSFAVIDFSGAKKTMSSQNVSAVFWIENILNCAPAKMSKAGFGDLLAAFVAYGDWYLASILNLTNSYQEISFCLMEYFKQDLIDSAESFKDDILDSACVQKISEALAMAGIAMNFAKETTPLSGFEHVISHALDLSNLHHKTSLVLHGEQVALGTIISSTAYAWLLKQDHIPCLTQNFLLANMLELLNSGLSFTDNLDPQSQVLQQIFSLELSKKNELWAQASEQNLIKYWPDIKLKLQKMVLSPEVILSLCQKAALDIQLYNDNKKLIWAIKFAPFIRARFCLADLFIKMGCDLTKIL